jgi:hypothetical protein
MKRSILVSGLLLITLSVFSESLGISVGADLLFGNVAAKNYQFSGKADPVFGTQPGLASIRPAIYYNKAIGSSFLVNAYLTNALGFDSPVSNDLKLGAGGIYNLALNNTVSVFSFSLDNLFRLRTKDWSAKIADGAQGWSDMITFGVRYTHTIEGLGAVYGKFAPILYVADFDTANQFAAIGMNPDDYKKPFVFAIPEIGLDTKIGVSVSVSAYMQFTPDPGKASFAPYGKYAADTVLQQVNAGMSYARPEFVGILLFEFPIPGKDGRTSFTDQGFAVTPTFIYNVRSSIQVSLSCEITNLGKAGDTDADKAAIAPVIGFLYKF